MTAIANSAAAQAAPETYEINTTLMESTFRITGPSKTKKGETTGGTVFILAKPISETKGSYVMVTAAHVFDDIDTDAATITFRSKTAEGKYIAIPFPIKLREAGVPLYAKHPDVDVAALYVLMPNEFSTTKILQVSLLANDDWLTKFEIHPGDELLCLGYPLFASADYGFPILRSGKIASYPLVPAKEHKNWLFDFRVFGGNSGGPVYIDTARNQIALRLHQLISNARQLWRTCDQRVCRRGRQCCASQAYCAARERARPADPEQVARTMALFHRMAKAQEERLDAEEDARLRNESHKKS